MTIRQQIENTITLHPDDCALFAHVADDANELLGQALRRASELEGAEALHGALINIRRSLTTFSHTCRCVADASRRKGDA